MTVRNPPSWLQQGSHPAENDRLLIASLQKGRSGVATDTALKVLPNSPVGMSVIVSPGGAYINGTSRANQGMYNIYNDANIVLTIAAADPSLARIDLVVAKIEDADVVGSTNLASIVVIQGTASGSPVAPSVPDNSMILAQISISAALTTVTTGNITDKRPYASSGTITVRNGTERDALTLYPGIRVFRQDYNMEQINPTGVATAASWLLLSPNEAVINRFLSNSLSYTNQTTYAVASDSFERSLLTMNLTKVSPTTRLIVSMQGTIVLSTGAAQSMFVGLRINGSDYDVTRTTSTPGARATFAATGQLNGIAAGGLTIEPVFKATTTSSVALFGGSGGDAISYSVREINP